MEETTTTARRSQRGGAPWREQRRDDKLEKTLIPRPLPASPLSEPLPSAPPSRLLAVDAGLRAGLAVFGADGRLERYRSTNFGSPRRFRTAIWGIMNDVQDLGRVVVEGGGTFVDPWLREAGRRGLPAVQVQAGIWREVLLLPRDRRTGTAAKEQADALARRVIAWSGAPRPTALRHDAAEAILVGLWGVLQAGWLPELPDELRPG